MHLSEAQSQVTEFHQLIRAPIADGMTTLSCDQELSREVAATLRSLADRCRIPTANAVELSVRLGLALEELAEWIEANLEGDLTAAADALGDRLYVLLGDAISVGVPIEPVFAAVHKSNMTKAAERSQANGKGVKAAEYRKPDLAWLRNNAPLTSDLPSAGVSIKLPVNGRFIGVDWSGAENAGRKIWVAAVSFSENNPPQLEFVRRPFFSCDAASVAAQFGRWLESEPFVAAGLDFCFGVSRSHSVNGLPRTGPVDLGRWITANYPTPQAFQLALGREDKRKTDRDCGSPFAPTNLRMFRQTYWGLRALADLNVPILPWGDRLAEKVVVEILPAHISKALCSDCRYKGRSDQAKLERKRLLAAILAAVQIKISATDEQTILDDSEGDAIDALLAALAAAAAKQSGFSGASADSATSGEGWIYSVGQ